MEAISSEIVHLLKVKLPLKMTRDDFSGSNGFQNFLGENPQPHPSRLENMRFFFNTAQEKTLVQAFQTME